MSSTDTVIIGAGPYGLSLAAHLKAAGVPHQIFGKPMHAWRDYMPPGMLMRSEAFASSLHAPLPGYTIRDYCRVKGIAYQPVGMKISRETFVDYAIWFQENLVNHVRNLDVMEVCRVDGLFRLKLSDDSMLDARRVVIALGLKGFEKMPSALQGLPATHVSHSCAYGDLTWAGEKDIVIVGGGQSALGLAALLHEVGARVRVFVRESSVTWNAPPNVSRGMLSKLLEPDGGLGPGWRSHIVSEFPFIFHMLGSRRRKEIIETAWGPSGAWWLRDRVIDKIDVSFRTQIRHAKVEGGRVVLQMTDGTEKSRVEADHVIAATGFKTDLRRHAFLSKEIRETISLVDGGPELTGDFESNIRGLYIIGPASAYSFGPVMRFIYGAKYAAPRVARHIGQRRRLDQQARSAAGMGSSSTDTPVNQAGH